MFDHLLAPAAPSLVSVFVSRLADEQPKPYAERANKALEELQAAYPVLDVENVQSGFWVLACERRVGYISYGR